MAKSKKNGDSTALTVFICIVFPAIAGLSVYNLLLGIVGKETTALITDMNTSEDYDSDSNDRTYKLTVSYRFTVDGSKYTGSGTYTRDTPFVVVESNDGKMSAPGIASDTIKVTYMPSFPSRNLPSDQVALKNGIKGAALHIGIIAAMILLTVPVISSHIRKRRKNK